MGCGLHLVHLAQVRERFPAAAMDLKCASGKHPFDRTGKSTKTEIEANIVTTEVSFDAPSCRKIPPSARDLIQKLLTRDPKARLSAKEMLQHEWLRETS